MTGVPSTVNDWLFLRCRPTSHLKKLKKSYPKTRFFENLLLRIFSCCFNFFCCKDWPKSHFYALFGYFVSHFRSCLPSKRAYPLKLKSRKTLFLFNHEEVSSTAVGDNSLAQYLHSKTTQSGRQGLKDCLGALKSCSVGYFRGLHAALGLSQCLAFCQKAEKFYFSSSPPQVCSSDAPY